MAQDRVNAANTRPDVGVETQTSGGFTYDDAIALGKWIADTIGGAAEGAAEGREEEGRQQISRENLALLGMKYANDANFQRYIAGLQGQQLELQQRQYQLDAPMARANQVARGDFMANMQDVNISQPSDVPEFNFTGGIRPSAFGPNTRAFGREMSRQALLNQMPSGPASMSPATATPASAAPAGGRTGPIVRGPRQAASMTAEEIASVYDRPERTEGAAGQIARAPLENVAGTQSPLVGRVVPRGDEFTPVAPPPPVTGFGGPMGGGPTGAGQSYGGNQRTGGLDLGYSPGGAGGGLPLGPIGLNTAGYAQAPGAGPNMQGWAQGGGSWGPDWLWKILGFGSNFVPGGRAAMGVADLFRPKRQAPPNYGQERDEWGPTEEEMGYPEIAPQWASESGPPSGYGYTSPEGWYPDQAPPTQNAWNVDPNNFGEPE